MGLDGGDDSGPRRQMYVISGLGLTRIGLSTSIWSSLRQEVDKALYFCEAEFPVGSINLYSGDSGLHGRRC